MRTYNWNAKDYKNHSQEQQKWAKELLGKLHLRGSEDVLDLGCGDGKVTAEIASIVDNGSIVGIDNSSAMINLAKEQYPSTTYHNLSFIIMDAAQLSFKKRFDVVFSNAALHWIKNHKPVLQGIYRSLKPGGRLLIQMGGKGNAERIVSIINKIQSQEPWQPYFEDFEFPYGFYKSEEYEQLLLDAGFCVKRIELIPKDMEHMGKTGLEGWIRTTWLPYTERVPKEKRDSFIEEIAAKYLEQAPMDPDDKVHVAMVRLEVEAVRIA
ncbi:MAG TPA: methyltransferase domain-containing protein [Nitrospirota bacterium]|nr:methyltransferase domain-containing protein [Nitrospirota bacterium]